MTCEASQPTGADTACAWLGHGLESLVGHFPDMDAAPANPSDPAEDTAAAHFDLVIVGSGYGAAVAARELAGCRPEGSDQPLSICILERGHEYLSGAFPSRLADLAGHVRFSTAAQATPRGVRTGLFDLRLGHDAMALVASGVGGGSLINAGVMLRPLPGVMQAAPWPTAIRNDDGLDPHFDTVSEWLGAGTPLAANTVAGTAFAALQKTAALRRIGGAATVDVPITVALQSGTESIDGVALNPCIKCGDCATGCNHGAKISLDVGLLAQACRTEGVALYTGATVLRLEKRAAEAGWVVVVQHTDDKLRLRQHTPFRLRARRVVLAAGTFGSTEILLRSRQHGLALSPMLGRRFSTNGDVIASVHGQQFEVNAVANEDTPPEARQIGPTITAMVDLRSPAAAALAGVETSGFVIQDLAVPGPLRRAFEEVFSTAATLRAVQKFDFSDHADGPDPCAISPAVISNSLPVAMIGHDTSDGFLRLPDSTLAAGASDDEGDGAVQIHWPTLRDDPRWVAQHACLATLSRSSGGTVQPNPVWQLLPAGMASLLGVPSGPPITVHPLGGCPMGDNVRSGVVDDCGRVFDATLIDVDPPRFHAGLVVLDGAIVPASLGINPALTIAALAQRAAQRLRLPDAWNLGAPRPATPEPRQRPVFRILPAPAAPQRTGIELVERMRGPVRMARQQTRWVELTLFSEITDLATLMQGQAPRRLGFEPGRCTLRVLACEPPATADEPAADAVLLTARLDGALTLFERTPRHWLPRTLCALWAWVRNRGLRDSLQALRATGSGAGWTSALRQVPAMARNALALASRAGGERQLIYALAVTESTGDLAAFFPVGTPIEGVKRLAYGRAANPLQQMMDMTLSAFPQLAGGAAQTLTLHLPFLAAQNVALLRVVRQQDQAAALVDFISFAGYVARILIDGHLWSFRQPDAQAPRALQRLPCAIDGAPAPEVIEIDVASTLVNGIATPVRIRLTRYLPPNPCTGLPPVLLIHGYSASGTTFAHPTLKPGLMKYLTGEHRRDVWIVDLRSSCGMPTATQDWAFEDMGCEDIPLAIDHVCRATGSAQVDVVAHCMGVAMLFMGLLGDGFSTGLPALGQQAAARDRLWDRDGTARRRGRGQGGDPLPCRSRIRRLVMSQVGPALLLTPANIARSYLMGWVKQFIGGGHYAFRTEGAPGLADQLLDRVLAALPYPSGEFEIENPLWPPGKRLPWVGPRHRLDALFGRVFSLKNMGEATLDCIDDFFGPFSVETVSQVMYFARYRMITDRCGFNRFVDAKRMRERLTFPMLSLHAADNGLADPATQAMLLDVLMPNLGVGGSLQCAPFAGLGHQDSLIGTRRATAPVFDAIGRFLQTP